MRQTRRLISVLLVIVAAATCGRNELSPTSPSSTGTFPFGLFDTDGTLAIASLTIHPSVFKSGLSTQGIVTLTGPALAGGFVAAVTADDTAATVPSSVTIPEGATSTTFSITTKVVPADVRIRVTVTAGETNHWALMRLTTAGPIGLTVDTPIIIGGQSATGTVTIRSSAPAGGTVVSLVSEGVDAIVPASITIAQGSRTGTFTIQTREVSTPTEVWLHATVGSDTSSVQIRVTRATSGSSGTGSLTLGGTID